MVLYWKRLKFAQRTRIFSPSGSSIVCGSAALRRLFAVCLLAR
jgi:hypothetical protein